MGKFNNKGLMKPTDKRYKSNLLTIQITGWKGRKKPKKIDIEKVREALMGLAQAIKEDKEKKKKKKEKK
tara:strand:+ start:61 stop:267 length:207 start_codon:yes stop_codon:yes gene_type:complete